MRDPLPPLLEIDPRARARHAPPAAESFLPDLCGVRALFAVVMIGQLLAFVLTLTRAGFGSGALSELSLLSLYVQWIGLSSAAALCLSRRWLSRLPEAGVALLSYALVMGVVVVLAELAWWVLNPAFGGSPLIGLTHADFFFRTLGISAIVAALILRYFYVQYHWHQQTAAEASARLQALQARIRPHFFFNCMNTIASLTRSDPPAAERAIEDLADLFRATLSDARGLVTLQDEFEIARRYLRIEALRLGARLVLKWDIATLPLDSLIPPLTLQPLVENAIYHGIEPLPSGGEISISGRVSTSMLEIIVSNPVNAEITRHAGNRLAQDNVRQRLAAHFGEHGTLTIASGDAMYQVTVGLPLQTDRKHDNARPDR